MRHNPEQILEDLVRRNPRGEDEELGAWLERLKALVPETETERDGE